MQKKSSNNIVFSVLDLATIKEGNRAADSFHNSLRLAKYAEQLGYTRYWVAEHHNMPGVASSATSILIGYLAAGTSNIRVGSGGIMLPNHAPLIVAEQFGTLASLYPGRIDLGLGRAPGTDQLTAYAIRGENMRAGDTFQQDIQELQGFFSADNSHSRVRAIPGEGLDIPIWILGSSTDSALLAAAMGLPYAFASHFAPAQFLTAIDLYRKNFRPSDRLAAPYVISCVNVIAADTDAEADRLATSLQQMFFSIISGRRRLLQPPVANIRDILDESEVAMLQQMLGYTFVGGPHKIKDTLQVFLDKTKVNEVMAVSHIYDQGARLHSYKILAGAMQQLVVK
jgi:luciferase family oxidoreductase group 1